MDLGLTVNRRACLAGVAAFLGAGGGHTFAAPTDPARVRLLGALALEDGALMAGVHIALSPGWKTYWRMPGDSGLPPSFTWDQSRNLAEAEVRYPAPARLSDGTGDILGYEGEVVFPVRVRPLDRARPVDLVLRLDFGVCERLCIPASSTVRLSIGRASPSATDARLLQAHLARVPRAVPVGTAVRHKVHDRAGALLRFHAELPGGVVHAVAEAPPTIPVPLPRLQAANGGITATVDLRRRPPGAAPLPLLITVVGSTTAVEETHLLD